MKTQKSTEAPKPMLEALQALQCDSRLKSAAYNFLKADITQLKSEADFRQVYAGLNACMQLLGPLGTGYRETLQDIRRTLDYSVKRRLLPARGFDQAITELQEAWSQAMDMLLSYAPQEVQEQVGELYRTLFDGIREDLANQ
jgi:hypothetical protein